MRCNLDEYRAGSTEPWTANILAALANGIHAKVIIETGTFEGRTTSLLFAECPHAEDIITVDLEKRWLSLPERVTFIEAEALTYLKHLESDVADFIFLDDSHEKEHVAAEIEEARRVLRAGGLCCIHDVIGPFGLDKIVERHGGFILELPLFHAGGGLGVIQKREVAPKR